MADATTTAKPAVRAMNVGYELSFEPRGPVTAWGSVAAREGTPYAAFEQAFLDEVRLQFRACVRIYDPEAKFE